MDRCSNCGKEAETLWDFPDGRSLCEDCKDHVAEKRNDKKTPQKKRSNKGIIIGVAVLILLAVGAFALFSGGNDSASGNTAAPPVSGDVQTAKLYVKGSTYVIEPSTFKVGVPVRLIADVARIPGCAKAVTIPSFGVMKYVSASDNVIEFTPTKTGTIRIQCSMSMYVGSFTVVE